MTGASVSVGLDEFMGLKSSMPFGGKKSDGGAIGNWHLAFSS
jgi:hypothetical protein